MSINELKIYNKISVSFQDLYSDLSIIREFVNSENELLTDPIHHMKEILDVYRFSQVNDFKNLREEIYNNSRRMGVCGKALDDINSVFNKWKQKYPNIFNNVPEGAEAITYFESDVAQLTEEHQENSRKVLDTLDKIDDWLASKNYGSDRWLTGEKSHI